MEYTKDTMVDGTVYERFEGTPEEIAELVMRLPQELKGGELGEGIDIESFAKQLRVPRRLLNL